MKYLKALLDKASPVHAPPPTAAEVVEPTPIITLDEIRTIIDMFDAKFLGVKPKGWLPEHGEHGV